ncbi:tudor domain-containing protein 1-like [Haemaphysalis longicornis]
MVKLDCLRPLHESHASVPALALHCAIPSVAPIGSTDVWPCAAVHQFQIMLNDADELHARFQWRDGLTGGYVVDLLSTPAVGQARADLSMQFLSDCVDTMSRLLVPQTAVHPAGATPAPKALPVRALPVQELPEPHLSPPLAAARPSLGRAVQIPPAVLPQTDKIPIRITVIVNPTEFYAIVHAEDDWEKTMEDMQKRLASCAVSSSPPMVDEIKEGTFWTCRFDPDGHWYRVRVTKSASKDRNQRAQVHFVDYGNSTLASVSNLRPLPCHLATLPACAHRMALSSVAPRGVGGEWDREAIEFFVAHTGFDAVFEARRKGRRDLG